MYSFNLELGRILARVECAGLEWIAIGNVEDLRLCDVKVWICFVEKFKVLEELFSAFSGQFESFFRFSSVESSDNRYYLSTYKKDSFQDQSSSCSNVFLQCLETCDCINQAKSHCRNPRARVVTRDRMTFTRENRKPRVIARMLGTSITVSPGRCTIWKRKRRLISVREENTGGWWFVKDGKKERWKKGKRSVRKMVRPGGGWPTSNWTIKKSRILSRVMIAVTRKSSHNLSDRPRLSKLNHFCPIPHAAVLCTAGRENQHAKSLNIFSRMRKINYARRHTCMSEL